MSRLQVIFFGGALPPSVRMQLLTPQTARCWAVAAWMGPYTVPQAPGC